MKRETFIVAYDIRHPGRLRRLHRYLSKRARALQYSVFLAELSRPAKTRLLAGIGKIIDPKKDDVRLYPVPPGATIEIDGPDLMPAGVHLFDRFDPLRRRDRGRRDGRPLADRRR